MSNVNFDYKGKKIIIQCNPEDKLYKICTKFASKINEPVEAKIYIYNNQLLNLEKTLSEQLKESNKENEEITISVNDIAKNDTVSIKYNFNGVEKELQVKRDENFLEIIKGLVKKPIDILFGGRAADKGDFDKNFEQLANKYEKERNQMNVLVLERSNSMNSNEEEAKEKNKENNIINENDEEEELNKENKEDNVKNGVNTFIDRLAKYNRYNEINNKIKKMKYFLAKFFLLLFAQYILIGGLVFLGCYFKLNSLLYKNETNSLSAFIPSIILLHFFFFYNYCYISQESESKMKSILIIIILYILTISLLLILLSNFVAYEYILYTLALICLDLLINIILNLIYFFGRDILFFFATLIFKSGGLTLIYFYLLESKDITTLVIIGIISLYFDIFITSHKNEIDIESFGNQFGLMLLDFNLRVFAPVILISIAVLGFSLYVVFLGIIYAVSLIRNIIDILFTKN